MMGIKEEERRKEERRREEKRRGDERRGTLLWGCGGVGVRVRMRVKG